MRIKVIYVGLKAKANKKLSTEVSLQQLIECIQTVQELLLFSSTMYNFEKV